MHLLIRVAPVLTLVLLNLVGPRAILAGSITVGGMAGTADGTAVAEARVELLPMLGNYDRTRTLLEGHIAPEPVATTRTDTSGRFSLEAPGIGVWTVVVRPAEFVPMRYKPLPLVSAIELPPAVLLRDAGTRIELLDDSGDPAAGVWVLAESGSEALWNGVAANGWRVGARIARSDPSGRLALPRAPGERLTITAFSPQSVGLSRSKAGEQATLVRPRTTELRQVIAICGARGEPIAGIVVAAGDLAWPAGRTGPDGRLSLGGDPPAPVLLHLFAADGRRRTAELKPPRAGAGEPARLVFAPPARIIGRIIADADRRPLAGALVWPAHDPGSFVLTDSRGAYELMAPPGDRFSVQASAAGFLPAGHWVRRGGAGTSRAPTLALTAAATAAGRVVDGTGAPLPGVVVEAATLPPARRPRSFHPDRADSRAASDSRGRFTLRNLHPQGAHELTAAKTGFAPARVRISPLDPLAPGERVRIVLEKARPAHGRVIDGEERPISGAEVMLLASGASAARRDDPLSVLTDERGRFDLATVAGPKVDIRAQKKGFSPLTVRSVEVPPGDGPIDLGTLILQPGVSIAGVITDADGEPIAEAGVWAAADRGRPKRRQADRLRREDPDTVSGPDGRFLVEDLTPGETIHLLVAGAGYLPSWVAGVEAPNPEALVVVLEPASWVSGQVVDEGGEPVPRARVSLRGQAPPPGTVGVELRTLDAPKSVVTDQRGSFVIEELPPAKVEIEASAAGFQPARPQYLEIPAAGSLEDLRLVLERGAVLEGRVVTAEGEPVAGARVRVGESAASSDADGIFSIEGVPLGRQLLVAVHPEFDRLARRVEIEPGVNLEEVVLEGGWPVAGRVVEEDGTPVDGVRIELRLDGPGEMRRYQAMSASDGGFSFPRVVDGSYDVAAEKDGYGRAELRRGLEVTGGPVDDLEVLLQRGASVVGRLLGLEFDELATVRVEAERDAESGRHGTVDYEGRYEINNLGPGVWLVKAQVRGGRRQAEARVMIEPGSGPLTRDLEFGGGITFSGRVSYGGEPLPETGVSVTGDDFALRRSVVTDYHGRFRMEDLRPGRYRLGVTNHRQKLLHNEDLELLGDRELLIEVATAQVRGYVISATTRRPLANAMISMQRLLDDDSQPGSLIVMGTDREGAFTLGRLSTGRHRLTVRKDGYAPSERILDVEAGVAMDDLELLLSPTDGLDLVLRLASGRSPNPATVSVLEPSGRLLLTETRSVASDGYVRFATVPPGTWELVVSAPGAAVSRVMATVPGPPLDLVLADGARLEIRAPELIESNRVATLTLQGQDGRPFQGLGPTMRLRQQWNLTGGTGVVEGVPAGIWTLRAIASDGRLLQGTVAATGGLEYEVILE